MATTWAAILLVAIPAHTALLVPYFRATGEQALRFTLAFDVAASLAAVASALTARRLLRPVRRWLRGERGPDLVRAAWHAAVVRPSRVVIASAGFFAAAITPPAVWVVAEEVGLSPAGTLLYLVMLVFIVAGMSVFHFLLLHQALRPVVRDIATDLPLDFAQPDRRPTLRRRLLVVLPLINLYTGMVVAAVSANSLGLDGRLAVTVAAAFLVGVTVSLILSLQVRGSVLERLDRIREAMSRVDRGDYDARLLPVGGDELDDVGHTFNAMVQRLRAHDEEMRRSRERIVAAADAARRRVERDLHDGAQQQLVVLQLKLGLALQGMEDERLRAVLRDARADLARALEDLRDLAHGIYPAALEAHGLAEALGDAARRAGLPTRVECEGVGRVAPELEAAVYFCCLEALQNAAKHAGQGAAAIVRLTGHGDHLEFEVADDGPGFEPELALAGIGLQNMADRVGALGGTLTVDTRPGAGTSVRGSLPLREPSDMAREIEGAPR